MSSFASPREHTPSTSPCGIQSPGCTKGFSRYIGTPVCGHLEFRRRVLALLGLDHVEDGVCRAHHPLRALVRSEPIVFFAQALDIPRLEEPENVADELRADVALCAEARSSDDGTQGAAEVALFARSSRQRRQYRAVGLNDKFYTELGSAIGSSRTAIREGPPSIRQARQETEEQRDFDVGQGVARRGSRVRHAPMKSGWYAPSLLYSFSACGV